MRTPSSTRRRLIAAAAIILFAAIIGWLVFSSPPSDTLTISCTGREPTYSNTFGILVTNTTRQSFQLKQFELQTLRGARWETLSEPQTLIIADSRLTPGFYWGPAPAFAPGDYRKILVTPPPNTTWRVEQAYSSESKGLRAWTTKVRFAIVLRNLAVLRTPLWSADRTNFTNPTTNAPADDLISVRRSVHH